MHARRNAQDELHSISCIAAARALRQEIFFKISLWCVCMYTHIFKFVAATMHKPQCTRWNVVHLMHCGSRNARSAAAAARRGV